MPHVNERLFTTLARYLKRHGQAPGDDVSLAVSRVWRRLEPHALHMPVHRAPRHTSNYAWKVTFAALTASAIFVLAATPLIRDWTSTDPARAVVDSADGSVYRTANGKPATIPVGGSINTGETIRTNGNAGAVLALADGSRVEMRTQSELSLERADDGIRIRLQSGSIIVNAAKQRTGHLYVQTKDMSVSVVGTIFLVNAATEGSSVAVIEGEVRVRETTGTIETKLRPGQQVSSNPALVTRPVKEEIAWSRNAATHISILDAFLSGMAATSAPLAPIAKVIGPAAAASPQNAAGGTREFEEASIRRCDADNLPPTIEGARGGGPNSFQMTPGRLHGLCLTLATILRHAYGYGPVDLEFLNPGGRGRGLQLNNIYGLGIEDGKRVRGGPDWVRTEHYTIEAVAADAADAASMSGPMLRSLLEKRFQLKTHIETEPVRAWTLAIASSGLKVKSVKADDGAGCDALPTVAPSQPRLVRPAQPGERQPPPPSAPGQMVTILFRHFIDVRRGEKPTCGISIQRNGPNQVIVAGGTTLEALARSLASPLGGVIVTDKTGNTDKFNIILEFVRDENTPGPSFLTPNQPEPPSNEPRGQTIFAALEEQLGLKLQPATASREFIVIDSVERLSPN